MLSTFPEDAARRMMDFLSMLELSRLRMTWKGVVIDWNTWERAFEEYASRYIDVKIAPYLLRLANVTNVPRLLKFTSQVRGEFGMNYTCGITLVCQSVLDDDVDAFHHWIYMQPQVLNNFMIDGDRSRSRSRHPKHLGYYMFALPDATLPSYASVPFHTKYSNVGLFFDDLYNVPTSRRFQKYCQFYYRMEPSGHYDEIDVRDLVMIANRHTGQWTKPARIKALAPDEFWCAERATVQMRKD